MMNENPIYIIGTYDGFIKETEATLEQLIWSGFDDDKEYDMLDEGFDFIISYATVTIRFIEFFKINLKIDYTYYLRKKN